MKIQDLVENTPLPPLETNEQPGFCPYCGSGDITETIGESTTKGCLGYWDTNHRCKCIKCNFCEKECIRNIKKDNEWYCSINSSNKEIILGVST